MFLTIVETLSSLKFILARPHSLRPNCWQYFYRPQEVTPKLILLGLETQNDDVLALSNNKRHALNHMRAS